MNKRLIFFLVLMFLILAVSAQKQANTWFFQRNSGIDFNTGQPLILDGMIAYAMNSSSISDSTGKFLFATDKEKIWNRNKAIMQNGTGLIDGGVIVQSTLIIKKPGSSTLYYVFAIPYYYYYTEGLYYSVVDMSLDNGLGAITEEKNILIDAARDVYGGLSAVKHTNGHDIWLITRKQNVADTYAAFLITDDGINPTPIISSARKIQSDGSRTRSLFKVSYDKKFIIECISQGTTINNKYHRFDISSFDASTGEINIMYGILTKQDFSNTMYQDPNSVEFSPDSKLVYFCTLAWADGIPNNEYEYRIYQYDMALAADSVSFAASAELITHYGGSGLQLATDGKIYCGKQDPYDSIFSPVSVINKPWLRGVSCNYQENAITFPSGHGALWYLSNILLDYLFRFEWEGHCSSEPFVFQSNFQPEPASIEWNFGDLLSGGNNISHDLNPVHKFTGGGEYEVHVHVEYPNGRIEETSRVVTVTGTPKPRLGPDKLKCEGDEITLNAGNEQGFYAWSTGQLGQNLNEITVSDTGWYWVQVNNDGCLGYDTIHVGLFPKPVLDESNLQLIPTACGGSTGKILGLAVSGFEPFSFGWFDADSNFLSSTLDLQNLPVGNYYLHILDGHGCTTISEAYTIEDAGDITISLVEKQDEHCGQNSGSINITAVSGDPDNLQYSIDNGNSWQTGNSLFENLPAGNYFIRVKDLLGCETVFENNPVTVENIAGPEVSSVNTTSEIDFL
ncbi:MAG TPA: PKD domain-containing protein, partial [Bacteroidales bacterium]